MIYFIIRVSIGERDLYRWGKAEQVPSKNDFLWFGESNWTISNISWKLDAEGIFQPTLYLMFNSKDPEMKGAYWLQPKFWYENGFADGLVDDENNLIVGA